MPRPLDGAAGERLELSAYYAEALDHFARAREFWKLERGQVYAEPDTESWRAFDRGDWEESLRLMEESGAQLADSNRQSAARGLTRRRVRIVSLPPSDYLLWELYLFKVRVAVGDTINVLLDREVASLEGDGPLPDLNWLDTGVMYQLVYTATASPITSCDTPRRHCWTGAVTSSPACSIAASRSAGSSSGR